MLAVDARRGHGEDRCTERGDLVLGAHGDGQGGCVRHDLAPQEGARAATHRAQSGELHAGARLDRVEVVAHFESDGFEDGAVHVGARVGAAPADDGASGDGVPVGGLDGVPVGECHEAFAARGNEARGLVEGGVGCAEELRIAEGFAEPTGQVGAGGLEGLEHVVAGDAGDVGAEDLVVPVDRRVDARIDGRAEVEESDLGIDGGGADAGCLAVAEAGDDGYFGDAPLLGEFFAQRAHLVGGFDEVCHLFAGNACNVEEFVGPVALLDIEEAEGVGGGLRADGASGEHPGDVAVNVHHLVGVSEDLGFVFLDPGHLVDGGGDAGWLSGELVDVFAAVAADLLGGAAVEPQDAVLERSAVLIEGGEGFALVGDADGCDAAAVCRRELGEHLPDGRAAGFPPADGVVLVLVHRGGV